MDSLHHKILQASSDKLLIINTHGSILAVNHAMVKKLGLKKSYLVGQDIFTIFSSLKPKGPQILEQAINSKSNQRIQASNKSGRLFTATFIPVSETDQEVEYILLKIQDKPDSYQVEKERYRLATAIEQAREAVLITDNNMRIKYINQAFETITGYAQQEVKGKNIAILFTEHRQKKILQELVRTLEKEDYWAGKSESTCKDGSTILCAKTVARIRGRGFLPMGYVSIWRDLSDLKTLEKQLRQAQKMEALATLAGGIAHDFNNILGPIILHAEIVLDVLDDNSPCLESIQEILHAAQRAQQLVDQILNLSRKKESEEPIPFQFRFLIKECLKLLRPSLHSAVSIVFKSKAVNDLILADPTKIHQLIMNLCTNATHAIGKNQGIIEIILSDFKVQDKRHELFPAAPKGSYIWLTVRDNGRGIEEEHLEKIFEPFFTTKHADKGTGLGLTVVKNIVQDLGGQIEIKSIAGVGTSVHTLLPSHSKIKKQINQQTQPGNIALVVCCGMTQEDQIGRNLLQQAGYQLHPCSSPFEAIALFRQNPYIYDLVISAFSMPEMSGFELAQELLLTRSDLPFIICSDHNQILTAEMAESLGIKAFIRTPFHSQEISEIIDRIANNGSYINNR